MRISGPVSATCKALHEPGFDSLIAEGSVDVET